MNKFRTFNQRLEKDLKNSKFKKAFDEENITNSVALILEDYKTAIKDYEKNNIKIGNVDSLFKSIKK